MFIILASVSMCIYFFLAYSPDHEYVYAYEAQLATGMPVGSKLFSGLKVKSDVRFQFKTVSRVTMKVCINDTFGYFVE